MNSNRHVCVLLAATLVLAVPAAQAQKCRFGINEPNHVESKLLILFRGGLVGLAGRFGVQDGVPYLRAEYASSFKSQARFSPDTPLTLALVDGSELQLLPADAARARLQFGHLITNTRLAEPLFPLTAAQWQALRTTNVSALTLRFVAKGEARQWHREVQAKHAAKLRAAINCLPTPH